MSKVRILAFYLGQVTLMAYLAYSVAVIGALEFPEIPRDSLSIMTTGVALLLALLIAFRAVIIGQFVEDVIIGVPDAAPNLDGVRAND